MNKKNQPDAAIKFPFRFYTPNHLSDRFYNPLVAHDALRQIVYSRSRITGKGNPGKKPQNLRADVKLPNIVVQAAKPFKIRRVKICIRPPNSLSRRTAPRDVERSFTRVPHGPQSATICSELLCKHQSFTSNSRCLPHSPRFTNEFGSSVSGQIGSIFPNIPPIVVPRGGRSRGYILKTTGCRWGGVLHGAAYR